MPSNPNSFNNGPQNNETAGEVNRTREQNRETGEKTEEAYEVRVTGKTQSETLDALANALKKDAGGMTNEELEAGLAALSANIAELEEKKKRLQIVQNARDIVEANFPNGAEDIAEVKSPSKEFDELYGDDSWSEFSSEVVHDEAFENTDWLKDNKKPESGAEPDDETFAQLNPNRAEAIAPSAQELIEKSRKNNKIKDFFKGAAAIAVAGFIGIAAATNFFGVGQKNNNPGNTIVTVDGGEADPLTVTSTPNDNRSTNEIEKQVDNLRNDSYKMPGNWLDEGKQGQGYSFSNAYEVGRRCNNDPKEIVKYVANQEEALSAYINEMPDEKRPSGFDGLSVNDIAHKIEIMDDEEFKSLKAEFDQKIDEAETEDIKISGKYWNYYIAHINKLGHKVGSKDKMFEDPNVQLDHATMQLVGCKTDENRIAKKFVFKDENGKELGSMIIKITPIYNERGELEGYSGCAQPLSKVEIGIDTITPTETPTDTPTPTEEEKPTPTEEEKPTPTEEEKPTPTEEEKPTPTEEEKPTPTEEEKPTPTEEEKKPKNSENMEKIDEEINKDAAKDINTGEITVSQTPSEEVETEQPKTEQPTSENSDFGLESPIVTNDTAEPRIDVPNKEDSGEQPAPVQTPEQINQDDLSPENNYSENRGGTNEGEGQQVTPNEEADKQANENEMSKDEARNMTEDQFADEMSDLLGGLQ